MTGRMLETAILAGDCINGGVSWPTEFGRVVISNEIQNDRFADDGSFCLAFAPQQDKLLVGRDSGVIQVYATSSTEHESKYMLGSDSKSHVTSIRFLSGNMSHRFLASSTNGRVYAASLENSLVTEAVEEQANKIQCLDISSDGDNFTTVGDDATPRVYNTRTFEIEHVHKRTGRYSTETESGHHQRIFCVKYHPTNSHVFVTGGWDGIVKIWDRRIAGAARRSIAGPHICGHAIDIKEHLMLTGSWTRDHALQLWDFGSGRLVEDIPFSQTDDEGNGEYLYAAAFCDNSLVLAGGSGTMSARFINSKSGKMVGEVALRHPLTSAAVKNGGRLFAVGCTSDRVFIGSLVQ